MEILTDRTAGGVLVADGAMGTELQRAGVEPGACGERWVLDRPRDVLLIHEAYVAAGADVILTATFGANRWALDRHGLASRVSDINRAAARLARVAAGRSRTVLGDIGPTGQLMEPLGPVRVSDIQTAVAGQVDALLGGGADGVLIETMTALDEAVAAVGAAASAGAPLIVASMAFDRLPDGRFRTMMGVSPEAAARALEEAGAHAVGANCGAHLRVQDAPALLAELRRGTARPLVIQPNAGDPRLQDGRVVYDLLPGDFADGMRAALAAGARVAGGCCGTTPAHVAALRTVVDEWNAAVRSAPGSRVRGD